MKTTIIILLIAIVIVLGAYIIYTFLSEDKENLQDVVVENNMKSATNSESEIMNQICSLGTKREKGNFPILGSLKNLAQILRRDYFDKIIDFRKHFLDLLV